MAQLVLTRGLSTSRLPRTPLRPNFITTWLQQRLPFLGIQARLVALVLAVGLPFVLYIGVSAVKEADAQRKQTELESLAAARLVAGRLADYLGDLDQMLATLSYTASPLLPDAPANDRLLGNLRQFMPEHVNNIAVWNLDGDNVGALDGGTRVRRINVRDRNYFRQAIATRTLFIEAPIVARTNGEAIALLARPLMREGRVSGVVSSSLQLRKLQNILEARGGLRAQSLISVVDRRGIVLAHSSDPNFWIGKNVLEEGDVQRMLAEKEGVIDTASFDGEHRLAGFSTLTGAPWLVLVGTPTEAALARARDELSRTLALGGSMLVLALILATWIGGHTAYPLRQLAADALRFGEGDLAYRSKVKGAKEVHLLASTLNNMAGALQERAQALEQSETRLRLVTDNMPAFIGYVDATEHYRFTNAYYRDVFGQAPEEVIGKSVLESRGEALYHKIKPHIDEALQGLPVSYEIELVVDGGMRQFDITYLPDYSSDHRVLGFYVMGLDITARTTAERGLRRSEERLRAITDNMPVLIAIIDGEERYRFCNAVFREWMGVEPDSLIGQSMTDVLGPEGYSVDKHYFVRALRGETVTFERTGLLGRAVRHMHTSYLPLRNEQTGRVDGVYAMVQDLTARKALEDQLSRLAQLDSLTGLPNRTLLLDRLQQACLKNERHPSELVVLYLDLDRFKIINDSLGHSIGDLVLMEFGRRLKMLLRSSDTVARMGGDEFVILLEGPGSLDFSDALACKILAAMVEPFTTPESLLHVSTSIGVATSPPARTWEQLLDGADAAMYAAKSRAGASYVVFRERFVRGSEAA